MKLTMSYFIPDEIEPIHISLVVTSRAEAKELSTCLRGARRYVASTEVDKQLSRIVKGLEEASR